MDFLKEETRRNKKNYDAFIKLFEKYDRIVVFRHIMPDFDALGCQFGLETWLKDNFKTKEIKTAGDNHVEFSGKIFPNVDKVSDKWLSDKPFLAIILDVGDKKRIADPRYEKADYVIRIDHHPSEEHVAKQQIVEPEMSSCAEIISNLLIYGNKKGYMLTAKAARYLYIGMVGDNGRFLYGSTSSYTFNVAAELINTGLNITKIYEEMYTKDMHDLEFVKYVISNYRISDHGVCYYTLTDAQEKQLGITCDEGKENVNFFSNYKGINIWCSISEDVTEPCFRISLRSRNYRVDKVANQFKGGGHEQAAGCQIKDLTELPSLIEALDKVVINGEK